MKHIIALSILATVCVQFFYGTCFARAPHQVGGFVLGENISRYKDRIRMDTSMRIRHREWLSEMEIQPSEGFKSGLLWYGNCASPGRIVRIILKYADSSKKFYEKLLKLCKERFGEPSEWRGDAFHIVIAWKWSLKDDKGNSIGLILQHNVKAPGAKKGNSIKLTMGNLITEESACFQKRYPETDDAGGKKGVKPLKDIQWERFMPH